MLDQGPKDPPIATRIVDELGKGAGPLGVPNVNVNGYRSSMHGCGPSRPSGFATTRRGTRSHTPTQATRENLVLISGKKRFLLDDVDNNLRPTMEREFALHA